MPPLLDLTSSKKSNQDQKGVNEPNDDITVKNLLHTGQRMNSIVAAKERQQTTSKMSISTTNVKLISDSIIVAKRRQQTISKVSISMTSVPPRTKN